MKNEVYSRTSNVRYYYQNRILWSENLIHGELRDSVQDFVGDCIPGIPGNIRAVGLTKIQLGTSLHSALRKITRNLK